MSQRVKAVNGVITDLNNVIEATVCLQRAIQASSHLPRMVVFSGRSGYGKTAAACFLMNHFGAYHIECKSTWTKKDLLEHLLQKIMGITPENTVTKMVDQVCDQLKASRRPLIIDEMDHLVKKKSVEVIRDIYDGSQTPIMLIGEENLPKELKKWERVHGRILDWTYAKPLDRDDAQLLADYYCQRIEIAPDLLDHIHRASAGSARRICVNLELVEELALRMGLSRIDLAAFGNHTLYTGEAPKAR